MEALLEALAGVFDYAYRDGQQAPFLEEDLAHNQKAIGAASCVAHTLGEDAT